MSEANPLFFTDRHSWRTWLRQHYKTETEVWLVYFKKHTKKTSIAYNDAVEEALCFGWIDGKVKTVDDKRFKQRYTPRNPRSIWSASNRKRVEKLIKQRKMTKAGLLHVELAKKDGRWDAAFAKQDIQPIPKALEEALKEDGRAWSNFSKFAQGYQQDYILYINMAKREDTKQRRIIKVVERCRKNLKPGMM